VFLAALSKGVLIRKTLLILAGVLAAARGPAATFTVLTANDAGGGSLRQAILDANANPGPDTIAFNIPGIGVHTVTLASPLPVIVDRVVINGYTQPGASANTLSDGDDAVLLVEIDGAGLSGYGLELQGPPSTIRGLVIHGFPDGGGAAILLAGSGGHVVAGNFIGTDAAGMAPLPNAKGVAMVSLGNRIGGTSPADRNLISGNIRGIVFDIGSKNSVAEGNFIGTDRSGSVAIPNTIGIDMAGGIVGGPSVGAGNVISGNGEGIGVTNDDSPALIQGNFIGTDPTGMQALPNSNGISVILPDIEGTVIGGAGPGEGNLISGNSLGGILLLGTGAIVQGNLIGTDVSGAEPLGNAQGIDIGGGVFVVTNNQIGGTGPGQGNVIAFNAAPGIWVQGAASGNSIRGNRIFRNGSLGIDLGADGVTPNDPDDADTGPNALLNFPLIRSVITGPTSTEIIGTFQGMPFTGYEVDFYWSSCNFRPRDFLEGENYLDTRLIFTNANGFTPIDVVLPMAIPEGAPVSATANDVDGNTSEFSQQIVFSIAPASGPPAGGTPVTIAGTNFDAAVAVTIGGVAPANVVRVSDTEITAEAPALPPGSLNDVFVMNPDTTAGTLLKGWVADFLDVPPSQQFYEYVTRLVSNGVTVGCGGGLYCVDNPTTRGQMAAFLIKARLGFCFMPPPATGTVFADVPLSNIYAAWIEELQRQGLTAGCGSGNYCPAAPVTRAQMAVFLLNTAYGPGYVPSPATGVVFDDVPLGSFAVDWIEDLVARGITAGCSAVPPLYCPANPITRGQMATFIVKTFDLQP
jgi:hypothetical protein